MTNQETYEIQIPFSGFYNSIHNDYFDREIESLADHFECETGKELPQSVIDLCYMANWEKTHNNYATAYVGAFISEIGFSSKFSGMDSPRYYNFETDRVFAKISHIELSYLVFMTNPDTLNDVAIERHSSRSGFVSFYDTDVLSWGCPTTWDHNQLLTLLIAYIHDNRDDLLNHNDDIDCVQIAENNYLYECQSFMEDKNFDRFYNITHYLIERHKRVTK